MVEKLGQVVRTTDFEAFKIIAGNRKDIDRRKKKIQKSVESVGYIPAPIIVNEKMEIIDGQARFYYCRETGTPITFYIIPGLTINDCIAMNISASNWGIMDYITSYAERGYSSYVLTEKFIKESPYSISPTMWALTGTETGNSHNKIKSGTLEVDQQAYARGKALLDYWKRFDDIYTNRRSEFLEAIGYCYLMPAVDNELLDRKIHQRPRDFQTIATITDAIDVIEDAYNVRARNHVYIETEYFKYLDGISKGIKESILAKRSR